MAKQILQNIGPIGNVTNLSGTAFIISDNAKPGERMVLIVIYGEFEYEECQEWGWNDWKLECRRKEKKKNGVALFFFIEWLVVQQPTGKQLFMRVMDFGGQERRKIPIPLGPNVDRVETRVDESGVAIFTKYI